MHKNNCTLWQEHSNIMLHLIFDVCFHVHFRNDLKERETLFKTTICHDH